MKMKVNSMIELYEKMVRIRKFEETTSKYYASGDIPGFVHLYMGEEAVATGVCANLNNDDYITSTHRGHGHLIAKGGDTKLMMAELFAKKTGYCKGKGGSMHICDLSLGIMGSNGIVGAGLPISVGVGFACKAKKKRQVCVCFFGDGASNRGTFHESLNLASIWDLPVIYACENNYYGISGSMKEMVAVDNISKRAGSYGIPGVTVDGNDVMGVYESTKKAVERARNGKGPTLIEFKTWRHHGHWEGDLDLYRNKTEHNSWIEKDPIKVFAKKLIQQGVVTQKELEKIEEEISNELIEAVKFAKNSPVPEINDLYEDVYA
jgi:acetoin:2,6-dichlorophenolindophenol oxidoreductase subunit alpha